MSDEFNRNSQESSSGKTGGTSGETFSNTGSNGFVMRPASEKKETAGQTPSSETQGAGQQKPYSYGNQSQRYSQTSGNSQYTGQQQNGQSSSAGNKYSHYQVHQNWPGSQMSPSKPAPKKKKKSGIGSKFGITVALALVFGLVAGVVFQGVNLVSERLMGDNRKSEVRIESTETYENDSEGSSDSQEANANTVSSGGYSVAQVADNALPSVVAITSVSVQQIPDFFGFGGQEYEGTNAGSGIIVGENDDELLIATNNHVIEGANTLSVCFLNENADAGGTDTESAESTAASVDSEGSVDTENAVSAKVKGTDEKNDLAVVAVQKSDIPDDIYSQIKIASLGDSGSLKVGEQVVAIGNALGYGQSVTSGYVSALDRQISVDDENISGTFIQTDAAINPGNSGGALLNMKGEVIGINSAKLADSTIEGMGYAIPISRALPILEDLMSRETRDKVDGNNAAYMGVVVADLTEEATQMYSMPEGAFVISVTEGGAADKAGIRKGDIITTFDGQSVSGKEDLVDKLSYYKSGETVEVTAQRTDNGEYKEQTFEVTLDSKSDQEEDSSLQQQAEKSALYE